MKSQLTGKIRIDGHVIIFTSDEFSFTFVRVDDYKDADGRYSKFFCVLIERDMYGALLRIRR
ncbi:hypothetical protein [Butyrivibrio sp.]|jgi:hypothetical protein|uniref:hypothetical protein n=1 Tax=Butyrivibrio sp. TaxID=28121 RepID=UPI0025C532D4|nr:hypothetical protein [Butyrivibrio sp.]MBE5839567.1 hypothetical protein [Butyrivibrio sp.]